jgi:FkbM family methyltransferase
MLGLRDALARRHRYASETAALASTRAGWLTLWTLMMLPPFKHRLPGVRRWPLRVDVEPRGRRHRLQLADRSDALALHEIFARGEYEVELGGAPDAYVDLGAHAGFAVLYFRTAFPGARVLAVEPNPWTFSRLRANVGALPGVELLRCAVGATEAEGRLDVRGESWASRLGSAGAPVRLRRLDALLREADVDPAGTLLKIDVEGAEWDVLSSVGPPLRFLAVVGEFHPQLSPVGADRFFSLFDGFDVRRSRRTEAFTAVRTT